MSDERNSKMRPPALDRQRREREISGIAPFFQVRFRRRGRSVSRIVAVQLQPEREGLAYTFEVFFALG
jgi:hypothetical protein